MPKKSARADNDQGQWETSSSSEEDWGNGEWEVLRIAEDHVNTRGNRRFKIEWGGWKRDDGSNSTWETEGGTTMRDLATSTGRKRWQNTQDVALAHEADSPTVSPFSPSVCREDEPDAVQPAEGPKAKQKQVFHYMFTELTHQARQMAIDRKDESKILQSSSIASASLRLQAIRHARDSALRALDTTLSEAPSLSLYGLGPAPQKTVQYQVQNETPLHRQMRSLQLSQDSLQNIFSPVHSAHSVQVSVKPVHQAEISSSLGPRNMSFSFQVKQQAQPGFKLPSVPSRTTRPLPRRLSASPDVQTSETSVQKISTESKKRPKILLGASIFSSSRRLSFAATRNPPSARDTLQAKWSRAVQRAGAAPVTFVDEFDKDTAPVDDIDSFAYLESEYIFSSGIPQPKAEFIGLCDCSFRCTASLCSCQDDSLLQDEEEESKAFAYDDKGLFAFRANMTGYVIECNEKCPCGSTCHSRVAQRPRQFPIEIFRTERCGWGVRSTDALPKGSVIGVYTGKLIPRARISKYSSRHESYIHDLDYYSAESSEYSVDAYNCGNWTRFINHSCTPSCMSYPVVWDSVPALHQPKLAFVAKIDIAARSEISIDYNPKASKGKGKGKAKIMRGTPDCMCGSEGCRGFIYNE